MSFFSIIIPTYNRAQFIAETVIAFVNQTFQDFEVIIVDDGSTDNTKEVVSLIGSNKVKYFYIPNSERGAARNFGAKKASGKYFNFFDSDDLPFSNHLANAYDFIQKNNYPEIFNVGFQVVSADGKIEKKETDFNYNINQRLIRTNFFACNSVFLSREVFLENFFNESRTLASAEDWELWLRLASRFRIISSDTITFQMNNHSTRSLFTINPDKVAERDTLLIQALLSDDAFIKQYKSKIGLFKSERYVFCALSYSLVKNNKSSSVRFLLKAIKSDVLILFKRRFWAVVKHLVIR